MFKQIKNQVLGDLKNELKIILEYQFKDTVKTSFCWRHMLF